MGCQSYSLPSDPDSEGKTEPDSAPLVKDKDAPVDSSGVVEDNNEETQDTGGD